MLITAASCKAMFKYFEVKTVRQIVGMDNVRFVTKSLNHVCFLRLITLISVDSQ